MVLIMSLWSQTNAARQRWLTHMRRELCGTKYCESHEPTRARYVPKRLKKPERP